MCPTVPALTSRCIQVRNLSFVRVVLDRCGLRNLWRLYVVLCGVHTCRCNN